MTADSAIENPAKQRRCDLGQPFVFHHETRRDIRERRSFEPRVNKVSCHLGFKPGDAVPCFQLAGNIRARPIKPDQTRNAIGLVDDGTPVNGNLRPHVCGSDMARLEPEGFLRGAFQEFSICRGEPVID
ncbi:hypothetical protein DXD42_06370 [Collinsella sp. TM04-9]|nr:hypothetical protein DXD42_06370 [Collinsella sp. TM04-9]